MTGMKLTATIVGVCALAGLSTMAAVSAQPAEDVADTATTEAKREQARIDRLWNMEWRRIVPYYVKHDGRYVCVPDYDKRLPSSVGLSEAEYKKQSVLKQEYKDERGKERTRTQTKPSEEVKAAVQMIPEVAVGQYGYIHSGNIERIVDDKTAELEDVWLLDAEAMQEDKKAFREKVMQGLMDDIEDALVDRGRSERRNRGDGILERRRAENEAIEWAFADREAAADRQRGRAFARSTWRVIGYKTDRLTEDARWPAGKAAEEGIQLVIVDVTGSTVTAIPATSVGKGLTVLDALNLLEERGVTKAEFVEMVTEAKREARADYIPVVLAQLEGLEAGDALATDEDAGPNDAVELAE